MLSSQASWEMCREPRCCSSISTSNHGKGPRQVLAGVRSPHSLPVPPWGGDEHSPQGPLAASSLGLGSLWKGNGAKPNPFPL